MPFDDKQTIEPFFGQTFDELEGDQAEESTPTPLNFMSAERQLSVDVYEDENNLYVRSPLPGVKPENLDINIDGEILTIQGSRHEDLTTATANFFCQECDWGNFSRSIVLPVPVISDKIGASLTNGILILTLPKTNQ